MTNRSNKLMLALLIILISQVSIAVYVSDKGRLYMWGDNQNNQILLNH